MAKIQKASNKLWQRREAESSTSFLVVKKNGPVALADSLKISHQTLLSSALTSLPGMAVTKFEKRTFTQRPACECL